MFLENLKIQNMHSGKGINRRRTGKNDTKKDKKTNNDSHNSLQKTKD